MENQLGRLNVDDFMNAEVELKLSIPRGLGRKSEKLPWLQKLAKSPVSRHHISSVYFDTTKLKLHRHGVTLRVRKDGSKRIQTIKGAPAGGIGRSEREDEIKSARPQLKQAKGTPLASLLTKKLKQKLRPVFRTDVRRSILDLQFRKSSIELAIDRGRLAAGSRTQPIHELELELKNGRVEDIAELARRLRKSVAVSFGSRTKADRGYALRTRKRDAPVNATPIELKSDQPAGSAFTQIGLSCLQHLAANEGAVLARDAEGIHQMRIGLRRLRAAISLFGDVITGRDVGKIRGELKWLAGELGPARDLDVLAKEAIGPLREENPDKPEIVVLEKDVKRNRDDELRRAADTVAHTRFRDVVLTTALWLLVAQVQGPEIRRRSDSIAALADRILARRSRKIIKKTKRLKKLDARRRHKLRIAVKKLRYGCEFFESLFDHPKAYKRYNEVLKELQDGLGHLNDIEVHGRRAHRVANSRRQRQQQSRKAYAMGFLTGGEQQKRRKLLRQTIEAGRRLGDAHPFW